jgi:hypothetical protein
MDQISARHKKLVARSSFFYFAKLVDTLQPLSFKLAPRYNYIPNISASLQSYGRKRRFWAADGGALWPQIRLPVEKIVKIRASLNRFCGGNYIDSTKLFV